MIDRNKPVAIEGKDWPVTIVDWDYNGDIAGIFDTGASKFFCVWHKSDGASPNSSTRLINVPETVEMFANIYAPNKEFPAGAIGISKCSVAEAKKAADNKLGYGGKHVAILKLKWMGDKLVGHELIEVE